MPGEPLMCVWQAVKAKDIFPESGVKRATVMSIVENFDTIPNARYTERRFKEVFVESKVDFEQFKKYIDNDLRAPAVPMPLLLEDIELKCWEMAVSTYTTEALNPDDMMKIWNIFNRLCEAGTYEPRISKTQTNFLFEKIAENLDKTWGSSSSVPEDGFTFQEMIDLLDKSYFSVTSSSLVRQCIEDIHTWLVREVMKTGWLYKRTRKNANWTNWLKRWFVMTPGHIKYYASEKQRVQKGEVIIDKSSEVESMDAFKSLMSKMEHRFTVENKPSFAIELAADSRAEKESWIKYLHQNNEAMKTGITPQMKLLQQLAQSKKEKQPENLQVAKTKLVEAQKLARQGSRRLLDDPAPKKAPIKAEKVVKVSSLAKPMEDDEGMYDNNVYDQQRDRIRAVFLKIDKDGNGKIDKDEFAAFINGIGAKLDRREVDLIFESVDIDKNKFICFEEFVEYFLKFVLEKSEDTATEAKLRAAFMKADRDGSGAVNFREFSEFAYSHRRSMAMSKLITSFDRLDADNTGEIEFEEFRTFFMQEEAVAQAAEGLVKTSQFSIEDALKGTYDETDVHDLAKYLKSRWNKFASFKRYGDTGKLVMQGGSEMVEDYVPGHYTLLDLACYNDLPPIEPKKVVIQGVQWIETTFPGKSGRAIFPHDFDGVIPIDCATNEHLAYYGSSLADGSQLKISLLYRHGIQDFTYENTYLDQYVTSDKAFGGAGIEHHEFSHLDCPLEDDSGYFVMGKYEGKDLHLTAFRVPTRHTIYVPPGVIHCNDYLKGTWRTMLSDEADVNHVQLVKMQREGNVESYEHFTFSFK